ncbi:MAG TPA: tape measure protein [Treponemataceae bacterium]|nr:tape measure protein [Treponemataceae bacterium]
MPELSRLTLEIDDKGIVTANGNLDIFKKKSADAAKAASEIGTANKSTAKSFETLNDLTSLHTLAMGAANLAVLKFADSVINAAGNMEMIKTQLRVVTGSAKAADETFRDLQEFAAKTPFGIEGITDTGIQLLNVGVAAEDLKSTLQMLGDAAGGSQEKLNRIMMNYTQILSVGKASTMDIRQFAQANLPIYAELEKVTGKSGEALQNMITNGQITGEVISKAFKSMTSEGGKFYQGMGLAADTYQGKLMTMQDSVENLAAKFGELWLLDFKKNALDAITAVADAAANALDHITFGKKANDAVFSDPDNASLEAWEYAANLQIAMWFKQVQQWKKLGGENYQESEGYQEALKNWNAWIDKLDEVTRKEKERTIAEREAKEEAERLAEAARIAAEEAAKWQEVLKKALSLEEVTTGSQAVSDYLENIETEMNGAIAWAQMYGESVLDVYDEYANKVKKAVEVLLKSGMWKPDEPTIQALNNGFVSIQLQKEGRQGFTNPWINQPAQDPAFMQQNPFALGDFGNSTGFNFSQITEDLEPAQSSLDKLIESLKGLKEQLAQFGADAAFDAFWDMGEALYEGGDAAQAFGRSLLQSILQNVPAMLFQAGFKLAISPGGLIPGLALMAMSGIAGAGAGYLNAALNDSGDSGGSERDELESLISRLEKIIDRTREETKYYSEYIRNYNANSRDVQSVQDAIIAPGGKIITTAPDDYLIATKTPGALGGGAQNISISVVNNAGDVANAQATTKKNDDGTTQIVVMVEKLVGSGIASGKFDTAFDAMQNRRSGIRRGT